MSGSLFVLRVGESVVLKLSFVGGEGVRDGFTLNF